MKKNEIKGFMLTETLIVTVFVCTVLIVLFTLLQNVSANFDRTYNYNASLSLYRTKEIKNYLLNNYLETLIRNYVNSTEPYFDISDCSLEYYASTSYCQTLYGKLSVDRVIFLASDFYKIKYTDVYSSKLDQGLIDFIDYVNEDNGSDRYRLVVSFKDGTYATIKFKGDNLYDE